MDYRIKIETSFDVEGEKDSITVENECQYSYRPEIQVINYDEQTEDGAVPTCIVAEAECVDIKRRHPAMPDMHLRLGETVSASIETPYGSIPTTSTTKRVYVKMNEDGGLIDLEYVMDIGGAYSKNNVRITVCRK